MKVHPQYENILQFDLFNREQEIQHFSTTRLGGVSNGTYASFNMGNFSDDNPCISTRIVRSSHVFIWRSTSLSFLIKHIAVVSLLSTMTSLQWTGRRPLRHCMEWMQPSPPKGLFLCVTTADCVPIILYDKKGVVAAIHAGWKGTVGHIVAKTINEMCRLYQSSPADILAGIGPSISQPNYEVGDEVEAAFVAEGFDLSDDAVAYRKNPSSKCHLDLKEINRRELIRLGILPENIEKCTLCTFEREDLFFSARRQTEHSGRMLTGIMMENDYL